MSNGKRWSAEDVTSIQNRINQHRLSNPSTAKPTSSNNRSLLNMADQQTLKAADAVKRFQALGRLPQGEMNKTEEEYSLLLESRKRAGEIVDWKFHPMHIRLANNTFYRVDFLVVAANLGLEIHETKGGYTTEKGQMKIKLCAEILPWFRFIKAIKKNKKDGGGWVFEEYGA